MRSGTHEVIAPNMIRSFRPQPHTGTVIQPQSSPGSLLLRHFQPLPPPDPLHPILAHWPACTPQQGRDPPVAVAPRTTSPGQRFARVKPSSSSTGFGSYRCVPRHCPSSRQPCRSDNPCCSRACSTAQRRRSGLRSFPPPPPAILASPATTAPPTASGERFPFSKLLQPFRLLSFQPALFLPPPVVGLRVDLRLPCRPAAWSSRSPICTSICCRIVTICSGL